MRKLVSPRRSPGTGEALRKASILVNGSPGPDLEPFTHAAPLLSSYSHCPLMTMRFSFPDPIPLPSLPSASLSTAPDSDLRLRGTPSAPVSPAASQDEPSDG
ncbi:hypothetical protein D4764_14G0011780 [Takifugu flavidus]|uniref:Uncharacterized protein n=1 Tax=Takifugu flavidus TaxID=433684 RepID=A0A5C6P6X5_9TELE|nr:hypothetical protein D4764_14G0011780 [Takifugu flavidus]